jgi:hypothetical protein
MSSLIDTVMGQLGDDGISQLSQSLNADSDATGKAVTAALPLLFGALAKNTRTPEGASALSGALDRDHDGSVLDGLTDLLAQKQAPADGNGILRHVLGDRRAGAEVGLSQLSGLDGTQVASMLATLAPVVMAALGRAKRQSGLDAGGVADLLAGEKSRAEGEGLGGLAGFLDRDHDGDIADDVLGGIVKGLAGKLFRRR